MTIVLLLCSIFLMPFLSEAQQKKASPATTMTAPRNPDRQDAPRQRACDQLSEAERLLQQRRVPLVQESLDEHGRRLPNASGRGTLAPAGRS